MSNVRGHSMIRSVLVIVGIFALGPAIGCAVLWLGCSVTRVLGEFCGHNAPLTLIALVVAGWLITVAVVVVLSGRQEQ